MHPVFQIIFFQWTLSGSLVDDCVVILKYVILFTILFWFIRFAPCFFDTSNAGPYLNGCYTKAWRGW
jgi:hypothetical protein